MCGAVCWTDHHLIIAKLNLHKNDWMFKAENWSYPKFFLPDFVKMPSTYSNIQPRHRSSLVNNLRDCVWCCIRVSWAKFKKTQRLVWWELQWDYSATWGEKISVQGSYWGPNLQTKEGCKSLCSNVKLKLRQMHDSRLSKKADEIQDYADRNDMKNFYMALKKFMVQLIWIITPPQWRWNHADHWQGLDHGKIDWTF